MGLPEIIIDNSFHYNAKNFSRQDAGRISLFFIMAHFCTKKKLWAKSKLKVQKIEYGKRKKTARVCVKNESKQSRPGAV